MARITISVKGPECGKRVGRHNLCNITNCEDRTARSFLSLRRIKERRFEPMDWKKEITKKTKEIGTYRPSFDVAIGILADILTQRDSAKKQWEEEGCIPVVELTNKATATHPCLKLVMDCEAAALPYLRELGLTPSGHKKIKGDTTEAPKECVLDDLKSRFKVG